MRSLLLLLLTTALLQGCAVYTFNQTAEQLDDQGNVVARQHTKALAIVANNSDEVIFDMEVTADSKAVTFGKTNTNGGDQVEALGIVGDTAAKILNPIPTEGFSLPGFGGNDGKD